MNPVTAAGCEKADVRRLRAIVLGAVQGVGFRPFVYRLATELGLRGHVSNSSSGVTIEVEGTEPVLLAFLRRLQDERPPLSFIQSLEHSFLDPQGYAGFSIRESASGGSPTAVILPDIAICPDCLAELFDPSNRRFRHPFITCTHCGPRFSIITALPYDRPNTSMASFPMCPDCRREYEDPADRRFHAQPIACPHCGPRISMLNPDGTETAVSEEALARAAEAVRAGCIVALKGIGGFQLIADARNDDALRRLRVRKRREEKPLAVMAPSLDAARELCGVGEMEARLLSSPEAPIVLLKRRAGGAGVAGSVAPDNPYLGVMLPYSPLHHLLLADLGRPVVATSGNLSEEPMCIANEDALLRLAGIADVFLVHDRPIVRHVDDSIARIVAGRELIMRRARGYAPLPVPMRRSLPVRVFAAGGHLKNTVGMLSGANAFLSQHVGDLETVQARAAFTKAGTDLQDLCGTAEVAVCDLHPDYASTQHARSLGLPLLMVQHHHAHVLSCMAENDLDGPVLGVAWDGTGLGTDGTIWGGEFLVVSDGTYERAAAFRTFRLPGGDRAIREPGRSALGILFEMMGETGCALLEHRGKFTHEEIRTLGGMLRSGLNSPLTSSAGRLFDAVASLLDIRDRSAFEGQAAMELEFEAGKSSREDRIELPLHRIPALRPTENDVHQIPLSTVITIDWDPLFARILELQRRGVGRSDLAALFHNTLAGVIRSVACEVGLERVVLSGGCFQNKVLTEKASEILERAGFRVYRHQRIPPNDGGVAAGQLFAAALHMTETAIEGETHVPCSAGESACH